MSMTSALEHEPTDQQPARDRDESHNNANNKASELRADGRSGVVRAWGACSTSAALSKEAAIRIGVQVRRRGAARLQPAFPATVTLTCIHDDDGREHRQSHEQPHSSP
jgi:hypothetical protein